MNDPDPMGAWKPFTGDCRYCGATAFLFGPRGGASRMVECLNCHAQFLWAPSVNAFMNNEAFTRHADGAHRKE